jgi:hypothetical protein
MESTYLGSPALVPLLGRRVFGIIRKFLQGTANLEDVLAFFDTYKKKEKQLLHLPKQ